MRYKDYSGPEQFRPLSAWAYLGYGILFAIPLVGWAYLLISSFSTTNFNRRSYARSYWCALLCIVLLSGTLLLTSINFGWPCEELMDRNSLLSITGASLVDPDTGIPYGVTPAFKETMDNYEAFFDSYVEFMENYDVNKSTTEEYLKYINITAQSTKTAKAINAIVTTRLTRADRLYYVQVTMRIDQKLSAMQSIQ